MGNFRNFSSRDDLSRRRGISEDKGNNLVRKGRQQRTAAKVRNEIESDPPLTFLKLHFWSVHGIKCLLNFSDSQGIYDSREACSVFFPFRSQALSLC
ncbi:hypothetical protein Naga_102180g2 [Nannochloropsis gaditana]|uniref:Uncharacterized protein n=1 Tax=Nannochloropsis gaditana TaxID=72520 RepID=W7TGH1_9STRA|nr:hypothetical protein Naga_102180g2 [Nannochloropsis gaditana]